MVRKVRRNIPYLVMRGDVYYFRYTLPLSIKNAHPSLPKEIKHSLNTTSQPNALNLIQEKLSLVYKLESSSSLDDICHLIEKITTTHLRTISNDLRNHEKSITIEEVWREFVTSRNWSEKQQKASERLFQNLLLYIGNVRVTEISKKDISYALNRIAELPRRNIKHYKSIPLEAISRMDIPHQDRISSKYVKEHLKLYQSFFSGYLVHEKEALDVSPTDGVRLKYENKRFGSFTDADIKRLVIRAKEKPEWFVWFIYFAIYSGARRSEIASLRREDIRYCPDTYRHYFVVSEGKTKAARRAVPIHRVLIDAGLLTWLETRKDLLFTTAHQNLNRVTDLFNSLLDDKVNEYGDRLVLHSLRHTFITKARAAGNSDVLVQQVVGHEKRGAGQTDRYTHSFQLKDVFKVVDSVSF